MRDIFYFNILHTTFDIASYRIHALIYCDTFRYFYFRLTAAKGMDVTVFVSITTTTATAPTASTTTSMVCHPVWPKYDMHNYPTWPVEVILGFTCSILSFFILCLRITALCTKRRLLKRLKTGPEGDLAERVRIEMVKAGMEIRREGDPRFLAWGAGGRRERMAGWKGALCLYGVLKANFLLYM